MLDSTRRRVLQAVGIGGTASLAGCEAPTAEPERSNSVTESGPAQAASPDVDTVAADPTDVPDPVSHDSPKHHEVTLEVREVTAEIEDGVTFDYMTFGGQVPGPMVRVREGDTVSFTLENAPESAMPHNVDFHAVYGTGGGSIATNAAPGEENGMRFRCEYPGAYIYHCAVPNMDYHISAGMFGMILVEPEGGLPEVDHEFYFGQHEVYTDAGAGAEGHHGFDHEGMRAEEPTYVLLNGEKYAYAAAKHGPLEASVGDTARVYMVTGGPNLSSNFHPIGNVWTRAFRDGALVSEPDRNAQTVKVPTGSCMVGEMEFPVPERVKFVDHALSRVVHRGMLAELDVTGPKKNEIFDPEPDGTDEGPIYGDGSGE
jgi:nitrite reductase (NO-forming)